MKFKIAWICLSLLLCSIQPLQANTHRTLLIASKQLPYLMYVEVIDEQHMQVHFISRALQLPTTCSTFEKAPIKKIDLKTNFACIRNTVEDFYAVSSQNYVYVHLNRIAKDLDLPYAAINFNKIGNITDYFAKVVKKLNISMLLKYSKYIESDLNLGDYYDYYHMFKGKSVEITYSFTNQVYVDNYAIPLDSRFHDAK